MEQQRTLITMDDGAVLAARVRRGDGVSIVLLHDLEADATYWDRVVARLHELDPTLTTVALDMRGHGGSSTGEPPSRKRLVKDVKRACRELGIDQPVLCGHGWGADVALAAEAAAVVAVNPRMGRAEPWAFDEEVLRPVDMAGARDEAALEACRHGLRSAKALRRGRRDAPLLLMYSAPADDAALAGTEVLEAALEAFAVQQGSEHLPVEMPAAVAALLFSWTEEAI